MTSLQKRLLGFSLGVLALLGALELLVRAAHPLIVAASHRALTKAAILDRHGPVDVLFFGSSRTQDGVSPRLFAQELAAVRPNLAGVQGFNLASASSDLEILEGLTERFATRPGLHLAVLELSGPQIRSEPNAWGTTPAAAHDVEGTLAAFVQQHVQLVANRRAFFSDNLGRLATLALFAPALDGSEVMFGDQFQAWRGRALPPPANFDAQAWTPMHRDVDVASAVELPAKTVERFVAIAKRFQQAGVRVVFAEPPLAQGYSPAPERGELHALFTEIGRRSGCEVWDWTDNVLPDDVFRGTSHLNPSGRALYSKALARQVVASGVLEGWGR